MTRKIIQFLLLIFVGLIGCTNIAEEKPVQPSVRKSTETVELKKSIIVEIFSQSPDTDEPLYGTGIVVDKKAGLILTARHGVYKGKVNDFKNENLFKGIRVLDQNKNGMDGYVVHLSSDLDDLALIKVDRKFEEQAVFIPSAFLKIKDEVDFWGYPGGVFQTLEGKISNKLEDYLYVNMNVAGGMSGGPIFIQGKGVVGIMMVEQKVGGSALRSEIVMNYLKQAILQAKRTAINTHSLCIKEIKFNESLSRTFAEDKPDIFVRLSVNGETVMETDYISVTGSRVLWSGCIGEKNKFQITMKPGDKIQFEIIKKKWGLLKTTIFEHIFEKPPQEGIPKLDSELELEGNTFFFETVY